MLLIENSSKHTNHLFLANLDDSVSCEDLRQALKGVTLCKMFSESRCAFVSFETINAAFDALKSATSLHEPLHRLSIFPCKTSANLWVCGVTDSLTESKVQELLSKHGDVRSVRRLAGTEVCVPLNESLGSSDSVTLAVHVCNHGERRRCCERRIRS